jgi:hypothetical protein
MTISFVNCHLKIKEEKGGFVQKHLLRTVFEEKQNILSFDCLSIYSSAWS